MSIGCVVYYCQLSFFELLFFISCTMLFSGPRGFDMQLSTLGVLNKDFVSC